MPEENDSQLGRRLVLFALRQIAEAGSTPVTQVFAHIKQNANIPERARQEGNYGPIWKAAVKYSGARAFVQAGFLIRDGSGTASVWRLTDHGKKQLADKDDATILLEVRSPGRAQDISPADVAEEEGDSTSDKALVVIENDARQSIIDEVLRIGRENPYRFQSLVAALFRGMGYYVRRDAPPGPDGGIDILAYDAADPLGVARQSHKSPGESPSNSRSSQPGGKFDSPDNARRNRRVCFSRRFRLRLREDRSLQPEAHRSDRCEALR